MIVCPYCHSSNSPGRHFCANCGRRIVLFCSQCGFANEIEALYCGGCGLSRNAEMSAKGDIELAARESKAPESVGSLVGDEVAHLVEINRSRRQTLALAGPRKHVTQQHLDELFDREIE